jgi:RimJ/RimL family protein N-acetyltransferase
VSFPERITSLPVVLRTFTLADAPHVAELCGDWEVARMTARVPHPYTLEMAESFIGACSEAWASGTAPTYAIARADDGVLVGAVGNLERRARGRRVARVLDRPAALGATVTRQRPRARCCRSPFRSSSVDVLTAIHLVRNPASGRVMAKCGMSEVRREMRSHRGDVEEFRVWQIDADAWERAAQRG